MLEFIKAHYNLIIECAIALIAIIAAIIRKRPINDIQSSIYEFACKAVNICESEGVKGSKEKLAYAVSLVNSMLMVIYPSIKTGSYYRVIVNTIENILETPQKKEV